MLATPVVRFATLLSCTVFAAAVAAQEEPRAPSLVDAARRVPLRTGRSEPPLVLGFRDGTSTVLVEVQGDRASGTIDGRPLPEERLVPWKGHWFVLDANGGVAAHLIVQDGRGSVQTHADRFRVTLGLVVNGPEPEKLLLYDLAPRSALEIVSVREGGPADRAGLQLGDVLVAFDGQAAVTRTVVRNAILAHAVGDAIPIAYLRGGRRFEGTIELARDYAAYVEADRPARAVEGPVGSGLLRGAGGELVIAPPRDELEDRVAALDRRMARIEALLERLVVERQGGKGEGGGDRDRD